jgi:hypothetical protein
MILIANRASALLYRFVKTFPKGPYLLPANVCPVVPLTFLKANVPFEFLDINEDTLCLDENEVIDAVSSNSGHYAGMVFVRTYGYAYDASHFFSRIKSLDAGFKIIDDKCLCYPDFLPIASSVDMELFSTGYAKIVDFGYGGYSKISKDAELSSVNESFNLLSLHFLENKYKVCLNEKILLGSHPGDWLDTNEPKITREEYETNINNSMKSAITQKQLINAIYEDNLPGVIHLNKKFQNWRYNILTEKKESILYAIFHSGLFASSHFIPSNILFNSSHFPIADKISRSVINLFNDFRFTEDQAREICKVICREL